MTDKKEFSSTSLKMAIEQAAQEYEVEEKLIKYSIIPEKTKYFGHKEKSIYIYAWVDNSNRESQKAFNFIKTITSQMGLDVNIKTENHEEFLRINITGKDFKLILYKNGELLNAFQYLLNRLYSVSLDKKIFCECQNFRKNRERELSKLAHRHAQSVKKNGKPVKLKDLNPFERRIIHMTVNKYTGIESNSAGNNFLKVITIRKTVNE